MIKGKGKPSKNTPGILGQEYLDTVSKTVYTCVNVRHITGNVVGDLEAEYEWVAAGSGGGVVNIQDEDLVEMLMEIDIVQPISDKNNVVYTDDDGKIFVL